METENHYCIINEYAFCLWHFSIMFSNVPPPPPPTTYYALGNRESESKQYFCIVNSAEKRRGDWKEKQVDKNIQFYSNFRTYNPMTFVFLNFNIVLKRYNQFHPLESFCIQGMSLGYAHENKKNKGIWRCHI